MNKIDQLLSGVADKEEEEITGIRILVKAFC